MGLLDFVKDAGEKLFGVGKAKAAMQDAAAAPADEAKIKAANDAAADAILDYIKSQNLTATGLVVTFDGASAKASVYGVAPNQATMEKIVLCCGNVARCRGGQQHDERRPAASRKRPTTRSCPATICRRSRRRSTAIRTST